MSMGSGIVSINLIITGIPIRQFRKSMTAWAGKVMRSRPPAGRWVSVWPGRARNGLPVRKHWEQTPRQRPYTNALILPLTLFPAFGMEASVRTHILCRTGGLGNSPTSRKGYSFPLLAKKQKERKFLITKENPWKNIIFIFSVLKSVREVVYYY